jgi:hypothetical protein
LTTTETKEPSLDTTDPAWRPPPPQPSAAQPGGPDARQRNGRHRAAWAASGRSGGAEGNERLTALTGTVLLALLAAEGVTILSVGRLLTPHFFIGMLLIGPVALKAGSTVYRFVRYYTGSAPYRRKGPPAPLLRLLGPLLIASTAYGRAGGYARAPRVAAVLGGRGVRLSLLIASLLAGLAIAGLTMHLAAPWQFGNVGR